MMKNIIHVDERTGEKVEGNMVFVPPKKKNMYERHFTMNQEMLMVMSQKIKSGEKLRVLMALMSHLDYENLIRVTQSNIAKDLQMTPAQVHRSISYLLKESILIEGPKVGTCKTFRLNPSYAWKGSWANQLKAHKLHAVA